MDVDEEDEDGDFTEFESGDAADFSLDALEEVEEADVGKPVGRRIRRRTFSCVLSVCEMRATRIHNAKASLRERGSSWKEKINKYYVKLGHFINIKPATTTIASKCGCVCDYVVMVIMQVNGLLMYNNELIMIFFSVLLESSDSDV